MTYVRDPDQHVPYIRLRARHIIRGEKVPPDHPTSLRIDVIHNLGIRATPPFFLVVGTSVY
jgi:hypothetical protein